MTGPVTLTLAEAAQILDPPLSATQLRRIVTALGWKPAGSRPNRRGRPTSTYPAEELLKLHAVLLPHMRIPDA